MFTSEPQYSETVFFTRFDRAPSRMVTVHAATVSGDALLVCSWPRNGDEWQQDRPLLTRELDVSAFRPAGATPILVDPEFALAAWAVWS
jgi:hypothetical protein